MPPTNSDQYAPTSWGSSYYEDVTVPSGQLCQVRRPGLEALMREGVLPRIDKLTNLVDQKHVKRVREPHKAMMESIDVDSLSSDQEALMDLLSVVDKVVEAIVIQPKIVRPIVRDAEGEAVLNSQGEEQIIPPSDREQGVIYTDYVDMEDRMFLLNYAVGGSRDLEQFRKQLEDASGSVGAGEDMESPAK